jgi:hypothetical protein
VESLEVGVLVDTADAKSGPATMSDFERIARTCPSTLYRRGSLYEWAPPTQTVPFIRADGQIVPATISVSFDILSLGAVTRARDIKVLQHFGASSSRDGGQGASDEICIRVSGQVANGATRELRRTVELPRSKLSFTTLTATDLIERLSGLAGPINSAGIYMPEQILDSAVYMQSLKSVGAKVVDV